MDNRQQILHFYRVEELSLRESSRKTGADRKTVTRLINAFEAAIQENSETGIDEFLADTYWTRLTSLLHSTSEAMVRIFCCKFLHN